MKTRLLCFFNATGFKLLKTQLLCLLMACALVLCGMGASAQTTAPNISYTSPPTYTAGTAITPLTPTNSAGAAGAVAATIYSNVTTFATSLMNGPNGIVADKNGNLYVIDQSNNTIIEIPNGGSPVTFAGTGAATPFMNGAGSTATFSNITGIAIDAAGNNLYVADNGNSLIRKIVIATGVVSTFAGTQGMIGNSTTLLSGPQSVVADASGNLYVSCLGDHTIRKITSTGSISSLAGTGSATGSYVNGTGAAAAFNQPKGMVLDAAGANLYVCDQINNAIRQVVITSGAVTTFAGSLPGTGGASGTAGFTNGTITSGTAPNALFNHPQNITIDGAGNFYVSEPGNNDIREITTATGIVTTLAGSSATGGASNNGVGTLASFNTPEGLYIDATGTIGVLGTMYVSDHVNNAIRAVSLTGYTISPALPAGLSFNSATGVISGTPTAALAATPYTITAFNYFGSSSATVTITVNPPASIPVISYATPQVYTKNVAITPLTPTNTGGAVPATAYSNVTTFATLTGTNPGPNGIVADKNGDLYITDQGDATIVEIPKGGSPITFVGTNFTNSTTGMPDAFGNIAGIAIDATGNLYVVDNSSSSIRKITPAGVVSNYATNGLISGSQGIVIDATGNLYISNITNNNIVKITTDAVVHAFVGTGSTTGSYVNATGASAGFNMPKGMVIDATGTNLYVCDQLNNAIRQVVIATGVVTTFAGSAAGTAGSTDGTITSGASPALFKTPINITIDGAGNFYITDLGNNEIRRITTATGMVTTVAGNANATAGNMNINGIGTLATFNAPHGMYIDATGTIGVAGTMYIADESNHEIRAMTLVGYAITPALPAGLSFTNTTGAISGTPTAASAATTYTVTAGNTFGIGTATINITVEAIAPPRFNYPTLPNVVFTTNVALASPITPVPLTNPAGGAIPANTFSAVSTFVSGGNIETPNNITTDGAGNLYETERGTKNDIIKIAGVSGTPTVSILATGFTTPYAITYSAVTNLLYVTDIGTNQIFTVNVTTGTKTLLAGISGSGGNNGGATVTASNAKFNTPAGIAVDASGSNVYIGDFGNDQIRLINSGMVSLFAGSSTAVTVGHADGVGTAATFSGPSDMVIDPTGNYLYETDQNSSIIRRITINSNAGTIGTVLTFAGNVTTPGSTDGTGTNASFKLSSGTQLAIDASGNLYVADSANELIRMITPAGEVFTIAGTAGVKTPLTNSAVIGTAAIFSDPIGIVWEPTMGNLFVCDGGSNNVIREITGTGYFIEGINGANFTTNTGLAFAPTTGAISGTPSNVAAGTYAVMGFNTNTSQNSYYTTIGIGAGFTFNWNGSTSTDWGTAANWTPVPSGGTVGPPGLNGIAMIPSGTPHAPTISVANQTVNQIQFTGPAATTLTITSPGSLVVNSALVVNTGVAATITGSGTTATLLPTATLNVNGTGTLAVGGLGSFTLQSNATGSASVGQVTTSSSITGNVTVQRYLQGGSLAYRGYRLLSSPVHTGTDGSGNQIFPLSYLNTGTGIPVTGPGGTTNGFNMDPNNFNNPSLFEWEENIAGTQATFFSSNYRAVGNLTTNTMPIGNGFLAFSRGLITEANAFITTTPPTAATLGATGTLNQGSVQVHLWYQPSVTTFTYTTNVNGASVPFPGYILVGNPYASSIDWDTFGTNGTGIIGSATVSPTMRVLDPVSHNYGTYQAGSGGVGTLNATNVIASGQGFFVTTTAAGATLTFNEGAKIGTQNVGLNLLESTSAPTPVVVQYLRLRLVKDSVNTDETMLRFTNTVTGLAYNKNTDATYLPGNGIESLASLTSDKVAVAIKALPLPGLQGQTIGLVVNASADGQYTLGLHDIVAVPQLYQIWLKDALAKDSIDLRSNAAYAFNITHADTNSFGSHRFSLVIRQNPALSLRLLSFAATKATTGALISWATENEANYTNFTVQRSTDNGVSFATIGGFASTSAGTYSFTDANPANPTDEYRLQLTDLNGTVTYSAVVTLSYTAAPANSNNNAIVIYPNPTSGLLIVSINQQPVLASAANQNVGIVVPLNNKVYGITIVNNIGLVVKTGINTTGTWQTDVSTLPPGTYIIQVVDNSNNSPIGKGQFIKL